MLPMVSAWHLAFIDPALTWSRGAKLFSPCRIHPHIHHQSGLISITANTAVFFTKTWQGGWWGVSIEPPMHRVSFGFWRRSIDSNDANGKEHIEFPGQSRGGGWGLLGLHYSVAHVGNHGNRGSRQTLSTKCSTDFKNNNQPRWPHHQSRSLVECGRVLHHLYATIHETSDQSFAFRLLLERGAYCCRNTSD